MAKRTASIHRLAEKFIPDVAIGASALVRRLMNHSSTTGRMGAETESGKEAGEGIGLSIIKHLCHLLENTLRVETPPEGGAVFRLRFPLNV
jgi:signal transduction histidine kinase